jgi:tetratricopeptide (TPR) repeat protein
VCRKPMVWLQRPWFRALPVAHWLLFCGRWPRIRKNPRRLVNASVLLVQVGRAQDALALLKQAEKLKDRNPGPMGISPQAILWNNEGYALIHLRRYKEAEKVLRQAAGRSPLLSEANTNLAAALLCEGNPSEAAKYWILGLRRQGAPGASGGFPGLPALRTAGSKEAPAPGVSHFRFKDIFDLSQGTHVTFHVTFPQTPEEGVAVSDQFRTAFTDWPTKASAIGAQAAAHFQNFEASKPRAITLRRVIDILQEADYVRVTPELAQMYDTMVSLYQQLFAFDKNYWETQVGSHLAACEGLQGIDPIACVQPWCIPATNASHNGWLSQMKQLDEAGRRWATAYYVYATGLAANLANPEAHQAIVDYARSNVLRYYASYVMGEGSSWTFAENIFRDSCVSGSGGPGGAAASEPESPEAPECPDSLKAIHLHLKLSETLEIAVNCEEIAIEGKYPPDPLLANFASVSYDLKKGDVTIFAGVKLGVEEAGAEIKAGAYVTIDSTGEVTDAGMRASGNVSVGTSDIVTDDGSVDLKYSLVGKEPME